MPSQAEKKAAAKVRGAEAIRDHATQQDEAQTHTCHVDCACQAGGEPRPDFVEVGIHPETGQSIPGIVAHIMPESEQRQEARREERTRIVALIEGVAMPLYDPDGNIDEYHGAAGMKRRILTAIQEGDE